MWERFFIRLCVIILIVIVFSLLYYFVCRDQSNWTGRDTDMTLFDAVFFTLDIVTTVGNTTFLGKSVKCQVITMLLYIVIIIGIAKIFSEMFDRDIATEQL